LGCGAVFTWNDYQTRVHDFALGMVELGLGRGDVIALSATTGRTGWRPKSQRHAIGAMSLGLYRDVLDEKPLIAQLRGEASWCSRRTKSSRQVARAWPIARGPSLKQHRLCPIRRDAEKI